MKAFTLLTLGLLSSASAFGAEKSYDCAWQLPGKVGVHRFENVGENASHSNSDVFGATISLATRKGELQSIGVGDFGKKHNRYPVSGPGPYVVAGKFDGKPMKVICEVVQSSDNKEFAQRFIFKNRDLCSVSGGQTMNLMKQAGYNIPMLSNFGAETEQYLQLGPFLSKISAMSRQEIASALTEEPSRSMHMNSVLRTALERQIAGQRDAADARVVATLLMPMIMQIEMSNTLLTHFANRLSNDPAKNAQSDEDLKKFGALIERAKKEYPRMKTQAQMWGLSLKGKEKKKAEAFVQKVTGAVQTELCEGAMAFYFR